MPKKKNRRKTKTKPQTRLLNPKKTTKAKENTPAARKTRIWPYLWSALLAVATLLGYAVLIPRVNISISDPVNPSDPFSSSVMISNTGYMPLDSVKASLSIQRIEGAGPNGEAITTIVGAPNYGSRITGEDLGPRDLGLDDRFTFALNDINKINGALKSADIAVVVQYEFPIIHFKSSKIFPYFARKQSNGNFYWYPEPPPK
ncbi:MAG TPA: hypothetical protein VG844_12795 [Terracidiphilus sp.]|nr:hypothetical protein [Terracidiphilus sp.]